jgi:hypothetical protein
MKGLIEFLKIVGTTAIVGIVILFFTKDNHFSCGALDAFSNESAGWLFVAFKTVLIVLTIWIVGLLAYFIMGVLNRINTFLYFAILTTMALHYFIFKAIVRSPEEHRELKEVICNKSSDDGMELEFIKLTKIEYDYVNSKTKWLPAVPDNTETIDVKYFRDDFFGEYHLEVELSLPKEVRIDSAKFSEWKLQENKYVYVRFQN